MTGESPFRKNLRTLWPCLVPVLALASCSCAPRQPDAVPTAAELSLLASQISRTVPNLRLFMQNVERKSTHATGRKVARLQRLGQGQNLADGSPEEHTLFRLLGLYARMRYESEMIALLGRLVALPTFAEVGRPQHNSPAIQELGVLLGREAQASGFQFRNVDNRIFEIILPGIGSGDLGIYTHGDVVPALPDRWRLPDGERIHPYRLRITKDRLYGRGTEDDKCSIVAALFALRVIGESGIRLRRTIRLMVETTEETGGEGMDYYKARHSLPSHNIVLDSSYPVVTAEKGFGEISARFPKDRTARERLAPGSKAPGTAEIIEIRGGAAVNQIPETSVVVIATDHPERLRRLLSAAARRFVAVNKPAVRMTVEARHRDVLLEVGGESAHSSQPERGLNPVSRALVFLAENSAALSFRSNAHLAAARYAAANFGLDDYGNKLGLAYRDDFMGPFTAVVTQIVENSTHVHVNVNLRMPQGRGRDDLVAAIRSKLLRYSQDTAEPFDLHVRLEEPLVRDPARAFVRELLDVFQGVTGRAARPISSAGATTARQLPNGVNFGPAMPEEKYLGHTALENKKRANFLLDVQLFTEMLLRLGQMRELD